MKPIEADILIVGSGITAALMAAKLAESTTRNITVVEAGKPSTPFDQRTKTRERYLAYGESPWKSDHLDDQNAFDAQPNHTLRRSRRPLSSIAWIELRTRSDKRPTST